MNTVMSFTMRSAPDKSFIKYVHEATSWNTLCKDFGYSTNHTKTNIERIKRRCRKLGVTYDHLTYLQGQIPWCYQFTDARFEEIISSSHTWMEVMTGFGKCTITSQAKKMIKKRCTELGVSYGHIDKKAKIVVDEASVYNPWLAPGCTLDEPGWRYS